MTAVVVEVLADEVDSAGRHPDTLRAVSRPRPEGGGHPGQGRATGARRRAPRPADRAGDPGEAGDGFGHPVRLSEEVEPVAPYRVDNLPADIRRVDLAGLERSDQRRLGIRSFWWPAETSWHAAGHHDRDANWRPICGQLRLQHLAQGQYAVFGHVVRADADDRHHRCHRRHIDNMAGLALGEQQWHEGPDAVHDSHQIDPQNRLPVGQGELPRPAGADDAGVVAHDVDAIEASEHGRGERVDLGRVADVDYR